ncbi:PilT protein-like protein [Trichormus variabilis ATCC 29413]|uniref:PilT protein-like protein n=3 Tax=Nostocales TaxID=1161 RepID=Q3MF45_TRIV2|nr:type II toxin-antitoxin system VapC family toxin [Trichormus variabilis]ABA20391.1 PilT protein-like protein [Trichormus variabilis ATCC 29413]MBC1254404.1 type II toxin-antitoxin system VapC family toxin [Trichormus variabilis V5]MBC1265526.1 type II toxin-antitoxin system VapC family toxin [Trichormus variabilis FSR]MBC1309515.1 type II toxin-antitoxin system VapC family toxin [Trichormus variabilis PNB]MBC1324776.1 type II toxin-antitoxin system VapC family toxin [Trichormus variabilis 9
MRLMLDTHTFLWFIEGILSLSDTAKNLIEDQRNQRFLSIASLWEISIKVSIGKLELDMTFTELVRQQVYGNAIELLEIQPEHLDELAKLPFYHKDPFDRLMISQSLVESITIVTKDSVFESYPVQILW